MLSVNYVEYCNIFTICIVVAVCPKINLTKTYQNQRGVSYAGKSHSAHSKFLASFVMIYSFQKQASKNNITSKSCFSHASLVLVKN